MKTCFKFIILLLISLTVKINKAQAEIKFASIEHNTSAINSVPSCTDTVIVFMDSSQVCKLSAATAELKRKKIISAILAFPFPFGFMGAHRVLLGCKPWVPVFYVATFGGCFGLLPLIDFCAIVFSRDIEQFENNPHVFMWVK